jgi:TctA family transporter
MLEQTFVQNMIKSDGEVLAFFERPIAGGLGIATVLIWVTMLVRAMRPTGARA